MGSGGDFPIGRPLGISAGVVPAPALTASTTSCWACLVAPRALLLVGGDSADGDRSWPFVAAALPVYRLYGGRPRVGLLNHGRGHTVPMVAEQRLDEWFETYL